MSKKLFNIVVKAVKLAIKYLVVTRFSQMYAIHIDQSCQANLRNIPNLFDKVCAFTMACIYVYMDWLHLYVAILNPINAIRLLVNEWQLVIPALLYKKIERRFINI